MAQFGLVTTDEIETENQLVIEGAGSLSTHMETAKEQFELAFGCFKKSVRHIWLMGESLTKGFELHKQLKKKNKSQPNWDVVLKDHGISVPSDNRARRLYKSFPIFEELQDNSIMEAYERVGITNSAKKQPATKGEATKSETSNKQSSSTPIESVNDNAEETSEGANESNQIAPVDFGDDNEADSESDTETQSTDRDLIDPTDESEFVLDDLDSMIADAESIQATKVIDKDIDKAIIRIDAAVKLLNQIKTDLEARHNAHAAA